MAAMAFHVFQAHRRLRHHQPVRPENGRRPVIGQTLPFADQTPAHRLSNHGRRPYRLHLDALPDLRHLGRHHRLPSHQRLRLQHARRLLRPHG